MDQRKKGMVYLIGAGPGDPGLITARGLQCLSTADVVVYDYLVNPELLRHARNDARLIYAGKRGGDKPTMPQDELNELLVSEANRGCRVARLKGGDPFIFGRGGEEAEDLFRAGIPFEIVPGVTSAIAVPAYAGIPLTHRGYTSSVAFVTGHEDPDKGESVLDWKALAGIGTLVFLMGVKNLRQIAAGLMAAGRDPKTPAALIRWGTTPDQETLEGELHNIAETAEQRGFTPPSILVAGEVASLRKTLNWFEKKPLFGKGVLIARPEEQAGEMAALLREQGARVIPFPTIGIVPPESWEALDAALGDVSRYRWIVFTSANGVRFFFRRLKETGKDIRELRGIRIACIGPATARLVRDLGIKVDIVPERFIAEGLLESFAGEDLKEKRVLLPRAEHARDTLPEGLASRGALVDIVTAYRTVASGRKRGELEPLLLEGKVDVIAFTSPSTVTNFMSIMGDGFVLPGKVKTACIGPVTAAAARKAGLKIDIMQEEYTIPGLVAALVEYFRK